MTGTVRIGILGAARIAPMALVAPSRSSPEAEVVAIAARDRAKAERFAAKHAIPTVHDTYDDVLADPDIDAVYVPLPNALHAEWTLAAIRAGKHVLCEKPFTSNAVEARKVAAAAEGSDLVVMEAFHYRYHPLVARMRELIVGGEIGIIERIETRLCVPYARPHDIRYRLDLAGGATMDVGCYTIHFLRTLAGGEPTVLSARAKQSSPGVDRCMQAGMSFEDGSTGAITCSLFSANALSTTARVVGTGGEIRVLNWTAPHYFHRLRVLTRSGKRTETCGRGKTYNYQLDAFTGAILRGEPILTPPADSIANMEVVDAVYEAAGLGARGSR